MSAFNKAELQKQIKEFIPYCDRRRCLNQWLTIGVGLTGIMLSFGATVAGIYNWDNGKIAAAFGAAAATSQGVLFAYPVERRERGYRSAVAKLKNLAKDLEVRNELTDAELKTLLEQLKQITLEAYVESNPTSTLDQAIEQIKAGLRQELTGNKSILPNAQPTTDAVNVDMASSLPLSSAVSAIAS